MLDQLGVDIEKIEMEGFPKNWTAFNFKKSGDFPSTQIILIEDGPKNIVEARSYISKLSSCIVLFRTKQGKPYNLFLKALEHSFLVKLESANTYEQMTSILNSCKFAKATSKMEMVRCVSNAIKMIPTHESDFDNRGVFSTHYIKNRLFDELGRDVKEQATEIAKRINSVEDILDLLGWKNLEKRASGVYHINDFVTIVVKKDVDLGIKTKDDIAPSYVAVSELNNTPWVILTNGTQWRLYTNKMSAPTTNYFEINLGLKRDIILQYLVAIFGIDSYVKHDKKIDIDVIFEKGKTYAQELEDDLSSKILQTDGIFLDLIKGVLDHDIKKKYTDADLEHAKQTSLKIMYRIWFLLYAESRDLLPVNDTKYHPISLQNLRTRFDTMEKEPNDDSCWSALLKLFTGIRKGSVEHNLPEYNGELFKINPSIDNQSVKNKFIVPAMRGLVEKDGEAMDYASLGVRHLGNIYEALMEFSVKQADKDIMLLEDSKGVREVVTKQESTYSYKVNDLYLASKGGIASRKNSASYYTPEEFVQFLVKQGLDPILYERENKIKKDLENYKKNSNDKNRKVCIDRLLDLQVLDPSMGSGHFLVEALNQITTWVTGILNRYRDHPLAEDIEHDRETIIQTQKKKGITFDYNFLKDDVLLKRKIMKRCIFGVDINPLAVELARLSLWLDSFAIGVPLTYMNHHLKIGDSTIGMWRKDLAEKNHTIDNWIDNTEMTGEIITKVSCSSDVTMKQVQFSEDEHNRYEEEMLPHKMMLDVLTASKIDKDIIPKKNRDVKRFVEQFTNNIDDELSTDNSITKIRKKVQKLSKTYKFFHWELEMMDAFTDTRRGFDLIVGNPPWDKVKRSDDEFFTSHHPSFRSLKTKQDKNKIIENLLKNLSIKKIYENYKKMFVDKSLFYKIYKLQGVGDRDLWQLVLERSLDLVTAGGSISMVIPSQLLSNLGGYDIRKKILDKDIISLYVFENKKKIFSIDSRYRFVLLTIRNITGSDTFPAGFYLHNLSTLQGDESEKHKFRIVSKTEIELISPNDLMIHETGSAYTNLLTKFADNPCVGSRLDGNWSISLSRGFDKTNDSNLLQDDGKGWSVLEGKHIHQFISNYTKYEFTADKIAGLQHEQKKRIYDGQCKEIHDSFRLAFRAISSPTNMRTVITAIIPPHKFYTHSLRILTLKKDDLIKIDAQYNRKIAYLCGIFNSMVFDFIARSKTQLNVSTVFPLLPIPNVTKFDDEIIHLSAKLSIGSSEFEGFAESLRIENNQLSPRERIETAAKLDALVALAYGLDINEYKIVINSFKLGEDLTMSDAKEINWSDSTSTMRNFFGEVRKIVLKHYNEYVKEYNIGVKI